MWFDVAIRLIQDDDDHPFFIFLATNTPHNPCNLPESYVQPYLDAGIEQPRARFYGMINVIDENFGQLRQHLYELNLARNTIILFMTDNGTTAGYSHDGGRHGWPEAGYNAGMRGRKGSAYEGGHRRALFTSLY